MDNEFSPDRYTLGPPMIRSGLKDMQKIFELEAEKSALLSASEALLEWARRDLMWRPIETAPNAEGSMFEVRVDCTNGYRKWTVNHLLVLDENGIHPDFDQGWAVDQYEYWRPILDTEPGHLPEPLEAFAAALKRVRGE